MATQKKSLLKFFSATIYVFLVTTIIVLGGSSYVLFKRINFEVIQEGQNTVSDLLLESVRSPISQGSYLEAIQRLTQAVHKAQIECFKVHTPFIHNSCSTKAANLIEVSKGIDVSGGELKASFFFKQKKNILNPLYYVGLVGFFLIITTITFYAVISSIRKSIFSDFNSLYNTTSKNEDQNFIFIEFGQIGDKLKEVFELMSKNETDRAIISMAKQLAHDIRSPLEVLKGLKEELQILPEESRRKIQMCINRTEEIAYNLLRSDKDQAQNEAGNDSQDILSLLKSIVIEKQLEYSRFTLLEISERFSEESYGLFSTINRGDLKSVVSNLINNAVEAHQSKAGVITIRLMSEAAFNVIEIADQGLGIPDIYRDKIFERGFTNKLGGHGLGLSGAREIINSFSGEISFTTETGKGTTFIIRLPKAPSPKGFVGSIDSFKYKKIIILDDDIAFHEMWKLKFSEEAFKIESFFSVKDIFLKFERLPSETLLLTDFELKDQFQDGIDVILKLGAVSDSILTTARSEERSIQMRCLNEGIRLLSKSVIQFLKIRSLSPMYVLIDNDKLILVSWEMYFTKRNINFRSFSSIDEFLVNEADIPRDANIYIDSHLSNDIRGEIESEKIHLLGFESLYLSTGYEHKSVILPTWIKGIHSKNPSELG